MNKRGRDRGYVSSIDNSFGLPAGRSCPGATPFCASCYALNSERYSNNVSIAMAHNLELLLRAKTQQGMEALLGEALDRFRRQFDRTGLPERDRIFRIHWDGDFFSKDYALAWRAVIAHNPDVAFWTYTRSFVGVLNVVPALAGLENLALYLSVDEHNWRAAHEVAETYDVRLALCGDDFRSARELGFDDGSKPIVCPENKGTLPLMNDKGRGACAECRLCIVGNRDIIFAASKVEDLDNGQGRLFVRPPTVVPVAIRSRRAT